MDGLPFWLQQLIYQAPVLLVYTLGMILGLVYWSRCSGAALMTVLGCGLLFVTAIGYTAVHTVLYQQMREGELRNERFVQLMSLLGLVSSGTRASGLALVVIAVFVGRGRSPRSQPDADEDA